MPPRRARAGKKARVVHEDDDYEPGAGSPADEAAGDEGEDDYKPPAKKAKAPAKGKGKAKTTGGRKKKLEVFRNMPLDVLALIMSHLDTKTLLAMSRTCSSFRNLLHSGQGISVWKAARRNIGLPDLKAGDLKEWEYASLMFDSTCHVCQESRAHTVDYTLRARACAKCMRANSNQRSKTPGGEERFHPKVWECCPESHWSPDYGSEVYKFFWMPTLRQVDKRLRELEGKTGYDTYLTERKRVSAVARQDEKALKNWEVKDRIAKDDEKIDAAASRKRKIEEKLLELGYTKQEIAYSQIQSGSLVNQDRDLTDRIWTSIKSKLVEVLNTERAERVAREAALAMKGRAERLRAFYASLHKSFPSDDLRALFPPFANFLSLPSVRVFWESEEAAPTEEDLTAARADIVAEANRFAAEIKMGFFARLAKAHAEASKLAIGIGKTAGTYSSTAIVSSGTVEQLAKQVTSAIECPSLHCTTAATFPAILDHYKVCGAQPLTAESLSTSPERIFAIKHIIAVVNANEPGKLSETTSTAELYALGKAFKCGECALSTTNIGWAAAYDYSLSWAQAVQHILKTHNDTSAGLLLPSFEYTPPPPLAAGPSNPGGFVVEEED
ncbi:hypothetical protein JCM10213_008084 [Rhodosporidiobolus nylandii]